MPSCKSDWCTYRHGNMLLDGVQLMYSEMHNIRYALLTRQDAHNSINHRIRYMRMRIWHEYGNTAGIQPLDAAISSDFSQASHVLLAVDTVRSIWTSDSGAAMQGW
jgi:hypothetical protein